MRASIRKKSASMVLLMVMIPTIGMLFQNCAKVHFSAQTPNNTKLTDPSSLELPPPYCEFNGEFMNEGNSSIAYQNSSVPYGEECVSETRVCEGGKLSGSFNYATCEVGAPRACLFNGRTIPHGGEVDAYLNSSVPYGGDCEHEVRACNDGTLTGTFQFNTCQIGQPASCLFNGRSMANGERIVAYQNSTVPFGQTCVSQVRVCTNGSLSGSYSSATCTPGQPQACLFNGRTIAHGESVTAFLNSSVSFGQTCSPQLRTCNNGVLSGSFVHSSCEVGAPQACLFNGQTIAHGQTVRAFQSSTVAFGQVCVSQDRTCNNGVLNGNYTFASCNVNQPSTCLFNGRTLAHGETVTGFFSSRVPFGSTCQSGQRTCQNGSLVGDARATYASCSTDEPAACLLNGETIAHGQSVVAYAAGSVPYGQTCSTQVRMCSNGTLSGTYTSKTCVVQGPNPCHFNGQVIAHGSSITTYAQAVVPFGQSCTSEQRTCNNGSLSGSLSSTTCQAQPPANCSFNGQFVEHGTNVTAFAQPSVPFGASCQAEARSCFNGYLSGSFGHSGCTPQAPRSCTFTYMAETGGGDCDTCYAREWVPRTVTLAHGQTMNLYYTTAMVAGWSSGALCHSSATRPRTCIDGTVTGERAYIYQSCYTMERPSGGSPLLIHFNSNNQEIEPLRFTSRTEGILFDILGRNAKPIPYSPLRISWYKSPQYFFLALPNSKGEVRGVDQLFGDNTFGPDSKFADDGYRALAKYDGMDARGKVSAGTPDGYITSKDPVFARLRLWNDANYDGVGQPEELRSLDEMGVEVIDLGADPGYKETDEHGNQTTLKSVVKTKDGRYHLMFDIWFALE